MSLHQKQCGDYLKIRCRSAWSFPIPRHQKKENKMHGRSHKIIRLPVHLERSQMIYYEEGKEVEALQNDDIHQTQLLAWFELNKVDPESRKLLYSEIPLHYTYNKGIWTKKRRISSKIITRLYSVSPVDKERFNLRILLFKC